MGKIFHSLLVLALLWAGNFAGLKVMSQFRIMEHLLSPGGHTDLYIMTVAAAFMVLRLWLFLLAPSILFVRLFQLVWSWFKPAPPEEMVETVKVGKTVKWVKAGQLEEIPQDKQRRR